MNRLLFGDNLKWLRDTKPLRAVCLSAAIFPEDSVDLEYLDCAVDRCHRPEPFDSDRNRVEHLSALCEKITTPLVAAAKPKRRRKLA